MGTDASGLAVGSRMESDGGWNAGHIQADRGPGSHDRDGEGSVSIKFAAGVGVTRGDFANRIPSRTPDFISVRGALADDDQDHR